MLGAGIHAYTDWEGDHDLTFFGSGSFIVSLIGLSVIMARHFQLLGKKALVLLFDPRRMYNQYKMVWHMYKARVNARKAGKIETKIDKETRRGLLGLLIILPLMVGGYMMKPIEPVTGFGLISLAVLLGILFGMFSGGGGGGGRDQDPPMGGDSDQRITPEVKWGR